MQLGSSAIGSSYPSSQRTSASSLPSAALSDSPLPSIQPSPPSSPLGMNVSDNIQSSYNTSFMDMSTVNLAGADVADRSEEASTPMKVEPLGMTLIDCTSGYCSMAPIFRPVTTKTPLSPFSGAELARSITARPGEEDRLSRAIKQLLLTESNDVVDAAPTATPIKVPEVNRDLKKDRSSPVLPEASSELIEPNEGVYSNIDLLPIDQPFVTDIRITTAATTPAPPPKRHKAKSLLLCSQSPSNNSSSEEKYPSYFPNSNIRQPKSSPRRLPLSDTNSPNTPAVVPPVRSHHHRTPRSTTNVFLSTPHSKVTRKSPPSKSTLKSRVAVDLRNINASRGDNTITTSNLLAVPRPKSEILAATENTVTPQRRYTKYASPVRRASPNRYTSATMAAPLRASVTDTSPASSSSIAVLQSSNSVDKHHQPPGTVSNLGSSIKRFASLPRFRKIDFSPLKMRINNVLQRTNSENL